MENSAGLGSLNRAENGEWYGRVGDIECRAEVRVEDRASGVDGATLANPERIRPDGRLTGP
jgi:hypothetical protein